MRAKGLFSLPAWGVAGIWAVGSVAVGAGIGGCGSSVRSASPPPASTALKGSPPPLARLHAGANQLLAGGSAAFARELAALRGYPVVVNEWASWCQPCQAEFPVFQRQAVAFGRRVAFLGVDEADRAGPAHAFLRRFPLSYPSYDDPAASIARAIGAVQYTPQTVYFDRRGTMVYDHAGPYLSSQDLAKDVRRYALGQA